MTERGIDDVGLDLEVDGDEIGRISIVGVDAANFGSSKDDIIRLLGGEEGVDIGLTSEIELGVRAKQKIGEVEGEEFADDGGAD